MLQFAIFIFQSLLQNTPTGRFACFEFSASKTRRRGNFGIPRPAGRGSFSSSLRNRTAQLRNTPTGRSGIFQFQPTKHNALQLRNTPTGRAGTFQFLPAAACRATLSLRSCAPVLSYRLELKDPRPAGRGIPEPRAGPVL